MRRKPICARGIVIQKFISGGNERLCMDGLADFSIEELGEIVNEIDVYIIEAFNQRNELSKQLKLSSETYV